MNKLLKEYSSKYGKVRHFKDSQIQDAVNKALAHVGRDKPVAIVGHVTNEGWKLSAAARIGDDWTIMAAAYDEFRDNQGITVSGTVVWTP